MSGPSPEAIAAELRHLARSVDSEIWSSFYEEAAAAVDALRAAQIMTDGPGPQISGLIVELFELAALEGAWYANVGKKTGERCCAAMSRAAAALSALLAERDALKAEVQRWLNECREWESDAVTATARAEKAEAEIEQLKAKT